MAAKKYDRTIARMAGNLLSGYEIYDLLPSERQGVAAAAVAMARAIVAECERTEPESEVR
jgi:hypothetical protein